MSFATGAPRIRARWADLSHSPDVWALIGLCALTAAVEAPLVTGGVALGLDGATQFVPWYAWLGEQLRSGTVPGWNPHTFAGAPFAGAALSGWGYVPAMVWFTVLPPGPAAAALLWSTLALAACGMYLLARTLRVPITGALVAAIALSFSGYLYLQNPCCFAFAQVEAWLPWTLFGVERAVAATGPGGRLRGWSVSGLALSQVLAAWLGQGSLYVLIALAAWILWRAGLRGALMHGAAVFGLGAALAAAGVLPRLELNAMSSLAGGYPAEAGGRAAALGGWRAGDFVRLVRPGPWYAGMAPLALACAAPFTAGRQRRAAALLAVIAVAAAVLALARPTPLSDVVSALPVAGRLHPHSPERALLLLYPAIALLAGIATGGIARHRSRWAGLAVLGIVTVELLWGVQAGVATLRTAPRSARLVDTDLEAAAAPAIAWLGRAAPGRVLGYAPQVAGGRARPWAYSVRWADPEVAALPVSNRSLTFGLADVQGYDPVHVARYDELIAAANGFGQDYHFADIRPSGLFSPILDLLTVRWIAVPSARARAPEAGDPARLGELVARLPTAYDDGTVRILERPSALPRAWLVHEARRSPPDATLTLLASGLVDPARTALLETDPPPLHQPAAPAAERADVVVYEPDRIVVRTDAGADALLVLSEVAYPAWQATVDDRPAEVLVADHALRAVAVPEGEHTVTLRFRSQALTAGITTSLLALAGLSAALVLTRSRP